MINRMNQDILRFYQFRKRHFINYINEGHLGPILFPEILKQLPNEEIQSWSALGEGNQKYFSDTLGFLGLDFGTVSEDYRNPSNETPAGRLINAFKYILRDDDKFNVFFDKVMEMKQAISQGRTTPLTGIFDEETAEPDDNDERTLLEDDVDDDERTLVDSDLDQESDAEPEDDNDEDYTIPKKLKSILITKSPVQITISENDEGFDVIEGERKVLEYLDEDPNNIVFVINTTSGANQYFLTSKSQLRQVIKNRSNIHYKCRIAGPSYLYIPSSDVFKEEPLFRMSSIGLPISYISLGEIKNVLENNKQIYLISREPIQQFKAVASNDVLDQEVMIASGAHCQYVEGDKPHFIYSLNYLDIIDVKGEKDNKRQRIMGGKSRTMSKKRKTIKLHKIKRHSKTKNKKQIYRASKRFRKNRKTIRQK